MNLLKPSFSALGGNLSSPSSLQSTSDKRKLMYRVLVLPFLAVTVTLLSFTLNEAAAITATDDGFWEDPKTWGGASPPIVIPPDVSVTIPAGRTITVGASGVINYGTIVNEGTINNLNVIATGGTFNNAAGGTINNSGILTNKPLTSPSGVTSTAVFTNSGASLTGGGGGGTINNSGKLLNYDASFTNAKGAVISNPAGALLETVNGAFTNGGSIEFSKESTLSIKGKTGILNNSGEIANFGSIEIRGLGTLANAGTLTSAGAISIIAGELQNTGVIANNSAGIITMFFDGFTSVDGFPSIGILTNNSGGTVTNNLGGIINNNGGKVINNAGGEFINAGEIFNKGTIANSGGAITNSAGGTLNNNSGGSITNDGKVDNNGGRITNDGKVDNNSGDALVNSGALTNNVFFANRGQIINNPEGSITNIFSITNYPGSTITNSGTINNQFGGTIANTGATITNISKGILHNSGKILNNAGGIIENESGGTITIDSGGIINNDFGGKVNNNAGGIIENFLIGTINNLSGGTINNDGTVNNFQGGTINNDFGTINNFGAGIFNNAGTGIVNNNFGGKIINDGTIKNDIGTITNKPGANIVNNAGGIIENQFGSTITNAGAVITNSNIITNDCSGIITGRVSITPNVIIEICDTDKDGIADLIDTQPATLSNDFSYQPPLQTKLTTGSILSRGDQVLTLRNDANPSLGVTIKAATPGGSSPATISSCDSSISPASLTPGDSVTFTCHSAEVKVITGPVSLSFVGQDAACKASSNIESGNTLTFYADTCTFTAPSTNPDTIIVTLGTTQIPIGPSASIRPVTVDVKPGSNPATISLKNDKTITVAVLGTASFDVNSIDKTLSTLKFGDRLTATPAPAIKASIGDVNLDGFKDLTAQFKLSQTNLGLGDTMGCIVGKLLTSAGGAAIEGCDAIRVIKG